MLLFITHKHKIKQLTSFHTLVLHVNYSNFKCMYRFKKFNFNITTQKKNKSTYTRTMRPEEVIKQKDLINFENKKPIFE